MTPTRAADLETELRRWTFERRGLVSSHLVKRFEHLQLGLLSALTYPDASFERAAIIARFFAWIFVQDDHHDEAIMSFNSSQLERRLDYYVSVLEGKPIADDAGIAALALAEIVEDLRDRTTPLWMRRFLSSMRSFWFDGVLKEVLVRLMGRVLEPETYMDMRIYSVCVFPVLSLIEFSQGFELPEAIFAHPLIQQLSMLAARIITYTNDIFSYHKERRARDPNNLIHVLMCRHSIEFPDAVDRVVRMHDRDLETFEATVRSIAQAEFEPAHQADVERYVQGHRLWIRGALDWQLLSQRYSTGRAFLDRECKLTVRG